MTTQDTTWLLQEKYQGHRTEAFRADCTRLAAGEPLGYVIGHTPFLNCQIWLDSRPLIPRPETEYWTEQAIAAIKCAQAARSTPLRVLDLCAGSGAIGVAVAKAVPEANVTWAELDPAHLPTIKKNLTENISIFSSEVSADQTDKYSIIASDLFSATAGVFDFILTNPPYVDVAANTVEPSVTAHEPHLALFGGEDGMKVIMQIITSAKKQRAAGPSELWIEHEPFQCPAIAKLAATHRLSCRHYPDQYHTLRYSILGTSMAK